MRDVGEADNAMDLDRARVVAPYFRIAQKAAQEIIGQGRWS